MAKGTVAVKFTGDTASLKRSLGEVDGKMRGFGSTVGGIGKAAGLGLAAVGAGAVIMGKGLIDAATESAKVTAQTGAVIKSMGLESTVSADKIADLSTQLSLKSGIDDELIQSGSNLLLTFGNLAASAGESGGAFDRANAAALDMSVAMGTDMASASMQVGKALNDPIAGISKLSRAGIQFTDEQKETIRTLQEGGDMAGAQAVMLEELEKQFGGSAEAQATAGDKMKVAWGNVQEELGAKLLPVFETVAGVLAQNLPAAIDMVTRFCNEKLVPAFRAVAGWAQDNLVPAFQAIGRWITEQLVPAIQKAADWFQVHLLPSIQAVGVWLRDELLPVLATVAGWILTKFVPAVAKIVEWLLQRLVPVIETVANWIVDTLVPAIQDVAGWITGTLVPAVKTIMDKLTEWGAKAAEIAGAIVGWFSGVVSFFTEMPGKIAGVATGMFDGFKNAAATAFNAVARIWNSTVGAIEFTVPDWVPGLGGSRFSVPDLGYAVVSTGAQSGANRKTGRGPTLHGGGIFHASGSGSEGPAVLKDGEGVFTPGQMQALGGRRRGSTVVNVNVSGTFLGTNQTQLKRELVALLGKANLQGIR